MTTPQSDPCPICESPLAKPPAYMDHVFFTCPQCKAFGLTVSALHQLPVLIAGLRRNRGILSYAISRKPRVGQNTILFTFADCEGIIKAGVLPTPQEQADDLIRLIGNSLAGSGDVIALSFEDHGGPIGAQSWTGFRFVVDGLADAKLLQHDGSVALNTLTFKGWERYEQLRRGIPSGRRAFMAMKFGEPTLDLIVKDHFVPAVAKTGFTLRRLDDEPKAGLIDDRMRAEIQASRFVIVDLTHMNRGAYWEAGYAEGLGKPVIYTCEEAKFGEASHFDTNHHQHVLWTESNLAPAVTLLKAAIRATILEATPEE